MECKGTEKVPPPERVLALLADTRSLARGIGSGVITTSQPRMASNLLAVASELWEGGHLDVATMSTGLLGRLSDDGLAADSVSLGSGRHRA